MLLTAFLRDNGWGPRCGYYLKYFGHEFHAYIQHHGFPALVQLVASQVTIMTDYWQSLVDPDLDRLISKAVLF